MIMNKFIYHVILASCFAGVVSADPVTDVSPKELTWKTYDAVSRHASQSPEELLYLKVDWKDTVLDAQREAYEKDKPIVMILFFGDHRSNC